MDTDKNNRWLIRDGTSQAARLLPELDPDYARVDERTTRDLLAFAEQYAHELRYFSVHSLDDPDKAGDWSGFIGPGIDLDDAADYARGPETFTPEKTGPYARPHFALFLTFLELLGHARGQINTLTHRHLEFFYHDVLKMIRKPAVPDHVHVLVDLDSGTEQQALPMGTRLHAGKDSLGRELVYRTDRELIAGKVTIGQISSLHAQMRITGIKQACPPNLPTNLVGGNRQEAFVAMLCIALGQPNPGDPLPVPVYPGVPPEDQLNPAVNFDVLLQVQKLIEGVESELGMPLFDDFRALMRWKRLRQENDDKDWTSINAILDKAGKTRTGDPNYMIKPQNSSDFEVNLQAALNKSLEGLFNGITMVVSIEDAYAYAVYINQLNEVDVLLEQALAPLSLDDFTSMMQIKERMDNQWNEINRLLGQAGRYRDSAFDPETLRGVRGFDAKLTAVLPGFKFPGGIDNYFETFLAIEAYFFMPAENFKYIMSIVTQQADSTTDDWGKVYEIVAAAHREMIYARRRDALQRVAQPGIEAPDNIKALSDVLAMVVGERLPLDDMLKRLDTLGVKADDQTYIAGIKTKSETAIDWARIFKVLEIAQRNRENHREPVPEKVEWRNLYPAPDAKKVLNQQDSATLPRWKTFGRAEPVQAEVLVPAAVFGWAMASPLLVLAEGERTITLMLGFSAEAEKFDLDKIRRLLAPPDGNELVAGVNPFQVRLSTAKGWLEPESVSLSWADPQMVYPKVAGVDTSKLRALVFQLTLSKSQPALAPMTSNVHGIDTPVPVLSLMLQPVWDEHDACYATTNYTILRKLVLMRAHLDVSVTGLADLHISNDHSTLDAKKPFEPFGVQPAVGSRFYLGHPEIVGKKLDSLSFHITWMGAPENFAVHYKNYIDKQGKDPQKLDNTSFKAKVSLVEANVLTDFPAFFTLFNATKAGDPVAIKLTPPEDQGNPDNAVSTSADVTEWHRYLVWELSSPDFQHSVYPNKALQKSLGMAAAIANKTAVDVVDAENYRVNPPYTPKIKSLSLDYQASAELVLDPAASGAAAMRSFHVQPFGYAELKPEDEQPGCVFLPQYDFEGELYIGLRNVRAPQNLSLLFQVAEGSADPDITPEPVQWSYLSGNRWLTLQDGDLLMDGTRGLINSGIVELALKPVLPNTLLPGDLYWIRAAIARSSQGVCDMVAIHPNAMLATFLNNNNAEDHLAAPLPAERITGPLTPLPGVARMRQPYTSFGGKMAEQDASFYVRVSERLRHKRRALTPWDYERLVLEKFPQIYKVKCLRDDRNTPQHEPGRIVLVVIPDIRNRLPFNPFEPKVPADQIRDIETFLQDKLPPFAGVEVRNARYVPVMVRCGVRFLPGRDEGFCRRRLNEELNRYLSPWAYEEGADLVIGGSVYANSIINFIDRRDYVDYLAGFKLFAGEGEMLVAETDDGYHVSASQPDDVLVAAREHVFDVISDSDYRLEEFTGINYMKIELDFTVA